MNKKLENIKQISLASFLEILSEILKKIDFKNHYTNEMNKILSLQSHDYHSVQVLADILDAMPDNAYG